MFTSANDSEASDSSIEAEIESSAAPFQPASSTDRERFVVNRLPLSLVPHTRAYIWGSALHDNIIMTSRESGIAQAVRMGSFVFLTNIRSTVTGDNFHPIFVDLPNSVLMLVRKHAPDFYAITFKVDMPTEDQAKKLVDRLLQKGYIEADIDFARDHVGFAGNDIKAKESCSPLCIDLANMRWDGEFMDKLKKAWSYLGWKEKGKINRAAQRIASASDWEKHIFRLVERVEDFPEQLEELKQVYANLLSKKKLDTLTKLALVLVFEIRLGVQEELAEDPVITIDWQKVENKDVCYVFPRKCFDLREPAPGYLEFVRNGKENELEPWYIKDLVPNEWSISDLVI